VRFHQAKVPFSFEASPIVADALSALIAAMAGRSGRALVLDLDNTLWGGVVADDGLEGMVIGQGSPAGEAFLTIQLYALELRKRGVVLAICSKNLEAIAREPFRSHPDMLLREEHMAVFLANFDDKATNLARIAQMLDLDTPSLVFLDDNPAERERVRSALPFVMVPELGNEPAHFARTLAASGFFEHLSLTADDIGRSAAYQARADAKALQVLAGDYDTYLRSLDMDLSISPFDAIGRARITQLIQKSNQFNLTTKRYSEIDIAAIENDSARLGWQVRLKDRFADHGMISVVVVDKGDHIWSIDSWIMSCRVLERGIEAALIRELARAAVREGVTELAAVYRPTARNGLVKELYDRLGFEGAPVAEDGTKTYRLNLSKAQFHPAMMAVTTKSGF
jgi:FkbH-like protein